MKINLIHQSTAKFRKADAIKKVNFAIVAASVSMFVIAVVVLAGQLIYYQMQATDLNKTLSSIQLTLNGRFEDIAAYLKLKNQAKTIADIEGKRVKYKEYLFSLYGIVPPSAKLSNVSFDQSGVIRVTMVTTSLTDYQSFLDNIKIQSENPEFLFAGVAQTKLVRGADGQLQVSLEIKIKK